MHYLPQEIEAWYIIPAIRKEISKCLIEEYKNSYDKIGKILGISKAAVSQYVKGKRAAKIKLPKKLDHRICSSCKLLSSGKSNSTEEINRILDFLKRKELPCCVCGKLKEGILADCKEIRFRDGNYQG